MASKASNSKSTATKRSTSSAKTSRRRTTRKTSARSKAPKVSAGLAAKVAEKKPLSSVESKLIPVTSGVALRKKELIEAVITSTGMKRGDVKKIVEAALVEMGRALQDSRDLNLQPFGNVKINRERKLDEGRVLATRIRQARDVTDDKVENVEQITPKAAE